MKRLSLLTFLLTITMASTYKEPSYTVIQKNDNIELRQYSEYVIARTSIKNGNLDENNNMFRNLGGYIFGNNKENISIPMTAPVITTNNDTSYDMIFFMLDAKTPEDLPEPTNSEVFLETMEMGKTISISFGMWATDSRVSYYKKILDQFINENNLEINSELMVAQYNSPWTLPPFRKNELLYKIK